MLRPERNARCRHSAGPAGHAVGAVQQHAVAAISRDSHLGGINLTDASTVELNNTPNLRLMSVSRRRHPSSGIALCMQSLNLQCNDRLDGHITLEHAITCILDTLRRGFQAGQPKRRRCVTACDGELTTSRGLASWCSSSTSHRSNVPPSMALTRTHLLRRPWGARQQSRDFCNEPINTKLTWRWCRRRGRC